MIRAGTMRHIVDVERRVTNRDATGGQVVTWSRVISGAYAAIVPLSGREYMAAGDEHKAEADVRIIMRARPGVDIRPDMRIKHGATVYGVVHARNDRQLDAMLEIMCKTGANAG